jgi:hypothetical protein
MDRESSQSMEAPAPPGITYEDDYPGSTKAAAVLLTLVAPFLSLIAALVLMGQQQNSVKKATLKAWAWFSGTLLAIGAVIVIMFVAAAASHMGSGAGSDSSGPCQGGPKMGVPLEQIGPHKYRQLCEFGGSTVVHLP